MVYRIYVERRAGADREAKTLLAEIRTFLGIKRVKYVRIINRYDVENVGREVFEQCVKTVFSEPQTDTASESVELSGAHAFAVEALPGQFDQRADSAAQCIDLIAPAQFKLAVKDGAMHVVMEKSRPIIRTAKLYALYGDLSEEDVAAVKKYVINPVECREASFDLPETLSEAYRIPPDVGTAEGFLRMDEEELAAFAREYGLAMDGSDVKFCQDYFKKEGRDPTVTEIRMIDTYWSDHCRHTTFLTAIDGVQFEDKLLASVFDEYLEAREELNIRKPVSLMDIGTIGAKLLFKRDKEKGGGGFSDKLYVSDEVNACTVKITPTIDGKREKWLLLFKNETHNHPTEIEPFGGAATCIGGAIRDPLSGGGYVYAAMRVTGAGDPLVPVQKTMKGKLPQRKIVTTAAAGYSSYGNQIGLATGQVDELYHKGYLAKRLEIGAVIAAVPEKFLMRRTPKAGDKVILLGGRTGRDGCGGATGSSKSHTESSLSLCGAEVQKGNAPEERKLQRLFRNELASVLTRRCNDFGAGGVSVAVGELADGLDIDLDSVPKKYEGLDGTELAISESQERMAVVVDPRDVETFIEAANWENLEATVVATVTGKNRLTMRWRGKTVVDVSREFLGSNGAEKHTVAHVAAAGRYQRRIPSDFLLGMKKLTGDLNVCSKRGLAERFDSTIGAGTVLMPFGGKYQLTPAQAMVHLISVDRTDARLGTKYSYPPVTVRVGDDDTPSPESPDLERACFAGHAEPGKTEDVSFMAWGGNPYIAEKSPYHGAYLAVIESVSKLVATGAEFRDVYLTFQEYFMRLGSDEGRWGVPLAALLGAFKAQKELGVPAIGGKDSMSGTFEHIDVPPTFISFAVTTGRANEVVSPEFKGAGHTVVLISPKYDKKGIPVTKSLVETFALVTRLMREGRVLACFTPVYGGVAEGVMKSCFGNKVGFEYAEDIALSALFGYRYGSFVLELSEGDAVGMVLGKTVEAPHISYMGTSISLDELLIAYEGKLEPVYPCRALSREPDAENVTCTERSTAAPVEKVSGYSRGFFVNASRPKVLIPVFPGTNCEYDTAKAFVEAGAAPGIFVIRNRTADDIERSVEQFARFMRGSDIVFIPGGFSGGDEPDGSGKFITAFFRREQIREEVSALLDRRGGLMGGICNGFQALIKLGLVPYGKIVDPDENHPTLTYNDIGRHQSRIVRVRVASVKSPWLAGVNAGDVYSVPISHGEGKFIATDETMKELVRNGQIMTQYVDFEGEASMDIHFNPNGSMGAVEGLLSPDGRVFGKMGHSERIGPNLYKNVLGAYDMKLFASAVKYFK